MNGPIVLVTAVGRASGDRAVAAALACAGSEVDRPGLLIDVGGRPPRPTLLASPGARKLEERLAVHLPRLRAASRGQTCHLAVAGEPPDFEGMRAALPLVRDSVAIMHCAPALLYDFLGESGIPVTGVLLCADPGSDRALTALAARELIRRQLRVRVLGRSLAWIPARRALFGLLPRGVPGGLPPRLIAALLEESDAPEQRRFDGQDDAETGRERAEEQQRRDRARTGRGRGLHRYAERGAGR